MWGQYGDVMRQIFTGAFLRGGYEATVDAEQLDHYEGLLNEFVAAIEAVVAAGADPLADVCELAVLGEQVGPRSPSERASTPTRPPVSTGGSDQLRPTRSEPGKLRHVGLPAGLRPGVSGR